MPKVGIVMGSDSDLKVMSKAADMLEKLGIDYEMTIIPHTVCLMCFLTGKGGRRKGDQSDHRRSRNGSTSSGNVCSNLSDAGLFRHSNAIQPVSWMEEIHCIQSYRCRPEFR